MNFTDAVQVGDVRVTADGYMVADVRVARTGIQLYRGFEIGKPESDTIRIYRSEDEVFDQETMASYAHKPVTMDHPSELVTSVSWKRHSIGFTAGDIARDGGYLRVPLMVADQAAIASVKDGKRELSAGYTCDLDWTAGTTPDGEPYDAKQVHIRANHIAVVDAARAGPACRIGDGWPNTEESLSVTIEKDRTMADVQLRTVVVDGFTIQVNDQGAQAIDKLQKAISDAEAKASRRDEEIASLRVSQEAALKSTVQAKDGEVAGLKAMHDSAIEAKDGEIAGLKAAHQTALDALSGEVAALKAKQPDAAQMDALIAARSAVIDAARKILGDKLDPKGKSDAEIRRIAVEKRLGAAAVADKSDDYIGAAFDTLTAVGSAPAGRDPVRDHFTAPATYTKATPQDADDAHSRYVAGLENAWQHASAKETV